VSDKEPVNFTRASAKDIADAVRLVLGGQRNLFNSFNDRQLKTVTYAKLTSEEGDGFYKAIEVIRVIAEATEGDADSGGEDDSTWENKDNGTTFDGEDANLKASELFEINGREGLANDTIVMVWPVYPKGKRVQWVFAAGDALFLPFQLSYNDETGIATVGARRDDADYPFEDSIFMALQLISKPNVETVAAAVDTNGVVYYIINISTFTATLAFAESLPANLTTIRHIVIGEIHDNVAFQVHYGYIRLDLGEVQVSQNDTTLGYLEDKIGTPTELGAPPDPLPENLFLLKFTSGDAVNETQELDGDIGLLPTAPTLDGTELVMIKILPNATGNHRQATTQEIADLFVNAAGACKVKVSSDDSTCEFLSTKLVFPNNMGDQPALVVPDNQALLSWVNPAGPGNEIFLVDFDIQELTEAAPESQGTGSIMFADAVTAVGSHKRVTFDDLMGDGLNFDGGKIVSDGTVFVSATDTVLSTLNLKIDAPTDLGEDDTPGNPDNLALMVWNDSGADQTLQFDFDITLITNVVAPTGSSMMMYSLTNSNGSDHNKRSMDDLSGNGITFGTGAFNLDINSLTAGTLDPINDFMAFWDVTATATNKKQSFDGMLKTISGYDAAEDQVLVNDASVLKWVDLGTFSCP